MPRVRTTKALAQRIDLCYFRKPHPFRTARMALIIACCLGAVAWWAVAGTRGNAGIYNPGPVAQVHAMWASNCAVCHTSGDGKHRFNKTVSDDACLRCHDGAIHHPNQTTLVVSSPDGHLRAARCASCHVEHRGREALVAASDAHCLQCHSDLSRHSRQTPVVQASIQGFADGTHPHFGRSLTPPGKTVEQDNWFDPTVLRFNHKVHDANKVAPAAGESENCTVCHKLMRPSTTTQPSPLPALGDGRYMQPIRYQTDCTISGCHAIATRSLKSDLKPNLDDALPLPHADLETVRSAVERYLRPALSAEKYEGPSSKPATGGRRLPGRPAPAQTTAEALPKAEWLRQNARFLLQDLADKHSASWPYAGAIPDPDSIPATGDPPAISDARFVDFYTAYVALAQCNKCHQVDGVFPSATASAGNGTQPLRTTPTGIPDLPRRWFVHSTFNHRAHRNLTCISCHDRAPQSELTSQVLSPDITWANGQSSCAQCHYPATSRGLGAGSTCVTCHVFHDRRHERSPDGMLRIDQAVKGVFRSRVAQTVGEPAQ